MLRRLACAVLVATLTAPTILLSAQLGAPNASGVSIGHVHLTVRNPEEHKKLWLLLGAQVTTAGPLELLKFPGIFVILTKAIPRAVRKDPPSTTLGSWCAALTR